MAPVLVRLRSVRISRPVMKEYEKRLLLCRDAAGLLVGLPLRCLLRSLPFFSMAPRYAPPDVEGPAASFHKKDSAFLVPDNSDCSVLGFHESPRRDLQGK